MYTNKYKFSDGLFNLNTLSPNEKYFYRIQTPKSINMSNFGCRIAFFNLVGELLYYNSDVYAHWLKLNGIVDFVLWSDSGKEAIYYEFGGKDKFILAFLNFEKK